MSKAILHRPARILPPAVPTGDVAIPQPPQESRGVGFAWWPQLLFPLVTSMGSVYFMVYFRNPAYIGISLTMALASVALSGAMIMQQFSAARQRAAQTKERYLAYLRRLSREAQQTALRQDESARFTHPAMSELWAIACGGVRVWERRPHDGDFLTVRVGRGPARLTTQIRLERAGDPMGQQDPALLAAAERAVGAHGEVPDQPLLVDLRKQPVVSL